MPRPNQASQSSVEPNKKKREKRERRVTQLDCGLTKAKKLGWAI
jgi:hypothetical protein